MLFCGSCMLLWLFDGSLAFAACPALVASVSGSCCLLDLGYAVWFVMFFGLYYHDISIQPSHDCLPFAEKNHENNKLRNWWQALP